MSVTNPAAPQRKLAAGDPRGLTVDVPKLDFRLERKDLYSPSPRDFCEVEVPVFSYLMIDGRGNPNIAPAYTDAVQTLFQVSYAARVLSRETLGLDYAVGPLEGLWYAELPGQLTDFAKDDWLWTMMIRQPDWLSGEQMDAARATAARKHPPALDLLRYAKLAEGHCVQILHIGSYQDEAPTISRMHHHYLPLHGWVDNGRHHEIYLNYPDRVAPEKLKTVLRQPVRPAARE